MRFSIGALLRRTGLVAAIIGGGLVVAGVSQAQSSGASLLPVAAPVGG